MNKNRKTIYCSIEGEDSLYSVASSEQLVEDMQFQKVRLKFYSDELNAHKYICSADVLKKYAYTIRGKPILAYYNKFGNDGKGDCTGHEQSEFAKEHPIGFIPNDAKIDFGTDENGTLYCFVCGYIWSIYYQNIIDVFKEFGGSKGISSEVLIIDAEELPDGITNILQMSFSGITILGEYSFDRTPIKPAVDGCKADLVTFSTLCDEYDKAKSMFEKQLYMYNSKTINESSKEGSFFMQTNKEDSMAKRKDASASSKIVENSTKASTEVVENATDVVTVDTKIEVDVDKYDDEGNYIGHENEVHKTTESKVIETEESRENEPTEQNACKTNNECKSKKCSTDNGEEDDSTKLENALEKCSQLETELNECKAELNTCKKELNACKDTLSKTQVKCNALEEYKHNKEMECVRNSVNIALNNVATVLSAQQMKEWKEKALNCSVETVDGFINELKAFAFDIQSKSGDRPKEMLRNSISSLETNDDVLPSNVWERAERLYCKED